MKILLNNNERQLEPRNLTIVLSEDVEFRISVNNIGEVVIQKTNFGDGESAINIKPSVSNEIRIT